MRERYDCSDSEKAALGLAAAAEAVGRGELVVMPTDTTYGVGADAFTPWAVARLMAARGQGRGSPSAVLVGTVRAAAALVDDPGPFWQDLVDEFWPGGLTLICRASKTLRWDLGDTRGTVAVRMPLHAVALDLLKQTGPMAVSSANLTGSPPATTADEAVVQLGDSVSVYLDGGPCPGGVPSTIVDLTGSVPRLMRAGAISLDRLREVAALVTGAEPATAASAGTPAGVPVPGGPAPGAAEPAAPAEPAEDAEADSGAASEAAAPGAAAPGAASGAEPGQAGAEAASGAAEKETGPTA